MIHLYKQFSIDEVLKKISRNDREIVRITDQVTDESFISHAMESENLFLTPKTVFISYISRDFLDVVIKSLSHLPKTTDIIWLEDSFPAAYLKKIPHHELFEYKEKKSVVKTNPFTIANALATGNGVTVWANYQDLLSQGFAPEELFGIIWWKLKDIAKKKTTLSPVFKKTTHNLLLAYATARETGGDLEAGLEKVLISLSKKDFI